MNRVYTVGCPHYDQAEDKLAELLAMMGGMGQFAAQGERIVLKANLLLAAAPERAITTHPDVVAAVGKMAKAAGAVPVIADSPGSGYQHTERTLGRVYRACGMYDAARKAGIDVNLDCTSQAVPFPGGGLVKRLDVITPVAEADGVFDLCKLKTHTYMGMTGAVKNCFGIIPGWTKAGYHAKLNDPGRFAQMLLDLSTYVSPRLSIMDAIVGMEGNGPNAGTPRHIGLLLASENPLALDVVASEIIGLPRGKNPVLTEAERRGLQPVRLEEVEVVGMDARDLRIPSFELPVTHGGLGLKNVSWWHRALSPLFKGGLTVRPRVRRNACTACGMCRDACPMNAITILNGRREHARIDDDRCIRCYCCHEMCPHEAIELRPSLLYRFVNSRPG